MRPTLVLVQKSLLLFFQNKAAVSMTFLVPVIMIYLFGHVFGLYRRDDSGPSGIWVGVVNMSKDPAAAKLVDALKQEKAFRIITDTQNAEGTGRRLLTEADLRPEMKKNYYHYALIIPEDLVSAERFGIRIRYLFDPRNDIESQMVNGLLQKVIFMQVPQLLGQSLQKYTERSVGKEKLQRFNHEVAQIAANSFGANSSELEERMNAGDFGISELTGAKIKPVRKTSPADPTLRRLDAEVTPATASASASPTAGSPAKENTEITEDLLSRLFRFEKEQVSGKSVSNPMAARLVGGYAIMFLLFAVSGSATAMFEEKRTGIFQRILSAPVTPAHIVWSRFIFGIVLGVIQISALFLAGRVFYHLNLLPHAGTLLAMTVAASAACTSLGMLLAAVAPTGEAVQGMATLIIMVMSAVGGAWFPISMMPEFIQKFSKFTVVYWSVEGFTNIVWAGQTFIEVLPTMGILLGIALVVMAVALWCFRRGTMFE